jgi:prefoldin subunit 5
MTNPPTIEELRARVERLNAQLQQLQQERAALTAESQRLRQWLARIQAHEEQPLREKPS